MPLRHPPRGAAVLAVLILVAAIAAILSRPAFASAPLTWSTYQHDLAHTGFVKETAINPLSTETLAPQWIVRAPDTISTQAIAANGLIYWGSWDGYEHATNPATGEEVWRTYLGEETKEDCSPPHLGVASSATVSAMKIHGVTTQVLYVGGGDGSYYALDANTGKVIWSHFFGSPAAGYFSWSSPTLYNNNLYVGVSSIGDCPLIPGQLVKLDAKTGVVRAAFDATPPGCPGAGVWTTPTIDQARNIVYVTTGTDGGGFCGQAEPYAQSFLQLTANNLTLLGAWKPPPSQQIIDGDFGATPTLFRARIGGVTKWLVGAANKNGIYYALDRTNFSAGPLWETQPIATAPDTIASSAWDGKYLYVAGHQTEISGTKCEASIRAVDPRTGAFAWSDCLSGGGAEGAVVAVPGVVFEGIGSALYGVSSTTGRVLLRFQDTSFHWFYSPAMVWGGAVYIGNSDGNFYKFTPEGK